MAKITIHCVRHAQGFHNLTTANYHIQDPLLTPLGKTQCETLSTVFPSPSRITDLVASPLRRTLYTCLLSFPSCVASGLRITALPELQETSDLPCDTGSSLATLEAEFGSEVDFSLVKEGWNDKVGKWSPAASAVEKRAKEARLWLRALGEQGEGDREIVVVTHGGYLHYFTEDWDGYEKFSGTGWANTEFRSYVFTDASGQDQNASLVETMESRERRRSSGQPLTADEEKELKATAENGWSEDGFLTTSESPVDAKL